MTAHFVDAWNSLNDTAGRVQLPHRFVKHAADLFYYSRIHFILRVKCENPLSGGVENHFRKGNSTQLSVFLQ